MTDDEEDVDEGFVGTFLKTIATAAEAVKDVEVIMPAAVVLARMLVLGQMDTSQPTYNARKELIYLMEREIIGAWLVKNSQSTVGEGAGIALMTLAPFAESVGEVVTEAGRGAADGFKNIADGWNTKWEEAMPQFTFAHSRSRDRPTLLSSIAELLGL